MKLSPTPLVHAIHYFVNQGHIVYSYTRDNPTTGFLSGRSRARVSVFRIGLGGKLQQDTTDGDTVVFYAATYTSVDAIVSDV